MHTIETGQRSTYQIDAALQLLLVVRNPKHSSVASQYIASLLTYTQPPYLIQMMHVLITVSGTSVCTCVKATTPRILHNSASILVA